MPNIQQTIEIDRIVTLARGFGWEKVEEKSNGDQVKITFIKTIKPGVPESPAP